MIERLPGANTLAYKANSYAKKNMWIQPMEPYSLPFFFFVTFDSPNKLEYYIKLGWKGLPVTYLACS